MLFIALSNNVGTLMKFTLTLRSTATNIFSLFTSRV